MKKYETVMLLRKVKACEIYFCNKESLISAKGAEFIERAS